MVSNESICFVYSATGTRFVDEALTSAKSVKNVMPDVQRILYTDAEQSLRGDLDYVFNYVRTISDPDFAYRDKIRPLIGLEFDKVVFLDTDTYMLNEISDVFELLNVFDLAFCHSPIRYCPDYFVEGVSPAFAEPNTGVLAFRRSPGVVELLKEWDQLYLKQMEGGSPPGHDQPSFREVVYKSEVKFCVLPCEYNLRTVFPYFKGGGIEAKILHGRGSNLDRAITMLDGNMDFYVESMETLGVKRRIARVFSDLICIFKRGLFDGK